MIVRSFAGISRDYTTFIAASDFAGRFPQIVEAVSKA
jgi:hypothetical protein